MRVKGSSIVNLSAHQSSSRAQSAQSQPRSGAVVFDLGQAASRVRETSDLPADVVMRLNQVRAQLADGSYPVDFDALAMRIADAELIRADF